MNDLVAVRHMKLMKLNVLSIKNCCRSCKKQYMWSPLRKTELTFPEHHLNEVIHTATDGCNGLFAPLLSRLRFGGDSAAIRGDLWRFANY